MEGKLSRLRLTLVAVASVVLLAVMPATAMAGHTGGASPKPPGCSGGC
jgi:hypothetical protein